MQLSIFKIYHDGLRIPSIASTFTERKWTLTEKKSDIT